MMFVEMILGIVAILVFLWGVTYLIAQVLFFINQQKWYFCMMGISLVIGLGTVFLMHMLVH
ncbi:MAG TPA: hypothetical protein VJ824_08730 [Bacillota bacterium]|nr:hypothetical protein [Bacillota bacterium]